MTNIYPRESVEFQPILITLDGVLITDYTIVETSVALPNARPYTWIPAVSLGSNVGLMIQNLSVGTYNVWVRITDSPEIPVINCGSFAVS